MKRLAGPVEILGVERAVETIEMGNLGDLLGLCRVAREFGREIAGQAQQTEADHRHGESDEDRDQRPVDEKTGHALLPAFDAMSTPASRQARAMAWVIAPMPPMAWPQAPCTPFTSPNTWCSST